MFYLYVEYLRFGAAIQIAIGPAWLICLSVVPVPVPWICSVLLSSLELEAFPLRFFLRSNTTLSRQPLDLCTTHSVYCVGSSTMSKTTPFFCFCVFVFFVSL